MVRALQSRNYRLFFSGQIVSLTGNWLTSTATAWLVYRITGSEALLGLVAFAGQFPTFLGAPFAGVWVDRLPLRRVLVITQTLAMLQSFTLAALVLSGHVHYGHLIALAVCQGLINAFDIPARQAFVVQMIEKRDDLPNAIALNSSMVNAARVLGPSIGGVMIARLGGEGPCFLIDGISYIAVIIALLMMSVAPARPRGPALPVLQSLKEGFASSFGFAPIRAVLMLMALVSLCGVPYLVLMPVFAKQVLHGGPWLFGMLSAASGLGALCGGVYLASRRSVLGIGRILGGAAGAFGLTLVAFSFSRSPWLSIPLVMIAGLCMILQMAGSNTLLQTLADDDKRGRVMAMFTMCFMGTVPIGAMISGALAQRVGADWTVFGGGIACTIGAVVFWRVIPRLRALVHPIYVARGILPDIAVGVRDAAVATPRMNG